jgi:hypothetical protein
MNISLHEQWFSGKQASIFYDTLAQPSQVLSAVTRILKHML